MRYPCRGQANADCDLGAMSPTCGTSSKELLDGAERRLMRLLLVLKQRESVAEGGVQFISTVANNRKAAALCGPVLRKGRDDDVAAGLN